LGDEGKIFSSDIVEIKSRKEMMEKVEYKVKDCNTVCCK
jgi:hypothetical protein